MAGLAPGSFAAAKTTGSLRRPVEDGQHKQLMVRAVRPGADGSKLAWRLKARRLDA
ncbi:hypothetical protein TRIUR3_29123 [Triticum urartu]|uniref:Uncharacterized protein n=1 Tax=Triticum urartu TaxID=4572 RepID=M7ZA15_TRIUA|nr:hypothetical protein TRIUR3_29123 [Triticum urartu]